MVLLDLLFIYLYLMIRSFWRYNMMVGKYIYKRELTL